VIHVIHCTALPACAFDCCNTIERDESREHENMMNLQSLHQCSYLNLDTKKDPNITLDYALQHGRYKELSSLDRAV
jgi:hypothetical protein